MMDKTCAKCGALLPDEDEGLCPSCGTPFGKQTVALSVTSEMLAHAAKQNAAEAARKSATTQQSPPQPPLNAPVRSGAGPGGLPMIAIVGGLAVIIILMAVLLALIL